MFKVGITGGIGSGKTWICKAFSLLGVPVYHADIQARIIMNQDEGIIREISEKFGPGLYTEDGLDRPRLASIIFKDRQSLDFINSLVHPRVVESFQQWIILQQHPYVIKEAAILFESGKSGLLDHVISVTAPEELRISRIIARDGLARGEIVQRMAVQMDEAERNRLADTVLVNDENQMILPKIIELNSLFLSCG